MKCLQRGRITMCRTITCHPRQPNLYPDVAEALSHKFLRCVHYISKLRTIRVGVAVHRLSAFASRQLVYRHSSLTSFDVPESLINSAQGIVKHRTIFPV